MERNKADVLLYQMFPRQIAAEIQMKKRPNAEQLDSVTIFYRLRQAKAKAEIGGDSFLSRYGFLRYFDC